MKGHIPIQRIFTSVKKPVYRKGFATSLTDNQRETLIRWLTVDNCTYTKAVARLKAEFGIIVARPTLGKFWHRYCTPRLLPPPTLSEQASPVRLEILMRIHANGSISFASQGKPR